MRSGTPGPGILDAPYAKARQEDSRLPTLRRQFATFGADTLTLQLRRHTSRQGSQELIARRGPDAPRTTLLQHNALHSTPIPCSPGFRSNSRSPEVEFGFGNTNFGINPKLVEGNAKFPQEAILHRDPPGFGRPRHRMGRLGNCDNCVVQNGARAPATLPPLSIPPRILR
jgi:hypothetical protein